MTRFPTRDLFFADIDFSSLTLSANDVYTLPIREREKGWVEKTEDRWHFTVPGYLISNTLIGILLETQASSRIAGTPWLNQAEYAASRIDMPKGELELFEELLEQQKS